MFWESGLQSYKRLSRAKWMPMSGSNPAMKTGSPLPANNRSPQTGSHRTSVPPRPSCSIRPPRPPRSPDSPKPQISNPAQNSGKIGHGSAMPAGANASPPSSISGVHGFSPKATRSGCPSSATPKACPMRAPNGFSNPARGSRGSNLPKAPPTAHPAPSSKTRTA